VGTEAESAGVSGDVSEVLRQQLHLPYKLRGEGRSW
jgi:hypothetical protein